MQGFGSRKSLDGSVDSKGSTPVSKSNPIEEALLGYLNKQAKEDDVVERASEEVVERKIFSWMESNMMELEELVSHSNITNLEDVAILKDFGVHLIVNLYCIRGKNFCAYHQDCSL